ncbi:MAG TPA: methyltransferase [Longimicrobiales bacterium]
MKASPLALNEWRDAAELAVVVAVAVETGLLQGLVTGPSDAPELAARLGLDARAVRIVLAVLAEVGVVEERDGAYALTPDGRELLADPTSPRYMGGGMALWLENLRALARLPESLETGEPIVPRGAAPTEEGIARFMAGMAARPRAQVERAVELALARAPGSPRVLDVGGGPGLYAREFLRRGAERVTLFDLPNTVDYVAEAYGLRDVERLDLARGNFLADPLPAGPFDVVLLSNILHIYSPAENLALLRKAHGVLRPGGVVAVGDMVRGRSPRAARFAIVMLLRTEAGDTYTEAEYREWLEEAGFGRVRTDDVDPERQLITAVRE